MKQIVSNYTYSPTTNVVTLTGVNIDQDQLLLVVAPQVGRTMYNFASVTGVVSAGANTRITLNASTAGLTTTSPLVIFYDDQASAQAVTGTVALDSASLIALENVTVTVGAAVTISNFPSTQTISGTVTANAQYFDAYLDASYSNSAPIFLNESGDFTTVGLNSPFPISGTVTVGNTVTIGSLPAISGTVTARLQDAFGNNLTSTSIGGVQRLNVSLASAATPGGTLPTFVNVYGGSDSGTVRAVAVDSSGRSVVTVSNFPSTQAVSLASTTVTVSALPSGALTTRFGSVTTASVAQLTSCVTNTSRKYLLAQNISAGTVTIGIGFSPTTTQGIQLTAGGGLTFDAFCPTGAVYWLGAVTGAAFTILEG